MSIALAIVIHILCAVIWVGGMFFAYIVLRPATGALEPPQRLGLWTGVFKLFFPWVWAAILGLLLTGYWMIFAYFGGFGASGMHIHIMHAAGLLMIGIFLHLFFAPYKRLRKAVASTDWPTAGGQLAQIRRLVGINLILGLIVVAIASGGRYLL